MKVLGVVYDIHHTFTPHMKSQGAKARSRLRIVKAAMGSNWGFSKEDGLLTYKALIAPALGYAAPVWLPARSLLKHPVAPLQSVQNAAFGLLRAAMLQRQSSISMTNVRCCECSSISPCKVANS
jgi:hypothetical protein